MMSQSEAYDLLYRVIVGLRLTYEEHCTLQQALHVLALGSTASSETSDRLSGRSVEDETPFPDPSP